MTYSTRLLITALTACAQAGIVQAPAQPATNVPRVHRIIDMLTHSDRVGLVDTRGAITEANNDETLEAQVVKGFKGLSLGDFPNYRPSGWPPTGPEYFVFLADTPKTAKIVDKRVANVGYSGVFEEAYPSIRVWYVCVFGGAPEGPRCDEGVKVCTDHIKLPNSLPSFPPDSVDPPSACRWVKKAAFISYLDGLVEAAK